MFAQVSTVQYSIHSHFCPPVEDHIQPSLSSPHLLSELSATSPLHLEIRTKSGIIRFSASTREFPKGHRDGLANILRREQSGEFDLLSQSQRQCNSTNSKRLFASSIDVSRVSGSHWTYRKALFVPHLFSPAYLHETDNDAALLTSLYIFCLLQNAIVGSTAFSRAV